MAEPQSFKYFVSLEHGDDGRPYVVEIATCPYKKWVAGKYETRYRQLITGVDFSAGMLAQARRAHPDAGWVRADVRALPFAGAFGLAVSFGALGQFLPAERPALFAGVYRALRPGGVFAFPISAPQPITSSWYWALLGFDLAMRVRNAVWRPPFVMYYRTCPLHAVRNDLTASGFTVWTVPLTALGGRGDGSPRYRLVLARTASTP